MRQATFAPAPFRWSVLLGAWRPPRPRVRWLQPDQLWRLPACHGGTLEVLQGAVWLTWEGCRDDHFVRRGECLTLPPAGRAIVQAQPGLAPGPAVLRWQRAGWWLAKLAIQSPAGAGVLPPPPLRAGTGSDT